MDDGKYGSHSSHWGAFSAFWDGQNLDIRPHPEDPAPSPILNNIPDAPRHRSRIAKPLVRRGWLENGPGPDPRRGRDDFIELEWDDALTLLAAELRRVGDRHGAGSIFGGSYGWSSAGRFHHAQSQVHRFLNCVMGGYVRSVNTYSSGAGAVILPHVLAGGEPVTRHNNLWAELAEETELIVAFGGLPVRNSMVSGGGNSRHVAPGSLQKAAARGAQFVVVSPLRDDLMTEIDAEWLAPVPGTDTALMLGIAHVLASEGLADTAFLERYTVGYPVFERYLLGQADGVAKTPEWATGITGIDAGTIRDLARRMARSKTLVSVAYALQRARFGEQPVWMGLVLGAMLGQLGLPGCGYAYALGSIGNVGKKPLGVPIPTLPQGKNGVADYIPVARIADMLLNPGAEFDYNGHRLTYPDIRLIYWAGGNPFHHHQDLKRFAEAFAKVDTVVIHDAFATASTRFADFVLPATITLERDDWGASGNDPNLIAMKKLVQPFSDARDDFEIFADLAERLGRWQDFTEGRSSWEWLRHIYEPTRKALADKGLHAPDFDTAWQEGEIHLPLTDKPGLLEGFRADPVAHALGTPSGLIEIQSETVASFGYVDCPGHPAWLEPEEWLGGARARDFPILLVANQPATRLHSQLDFGAHSRSEKVAGRERLRLHPLDAAARGIADGDVVRVFNDRGACLAGVQISDLVRQGVAQLSTGAWYDPQYVDGLGEVCAHGNPNVLTRDIGTSSLAQGCAGQVVLVEIARLEVEPPPVRAHDGAKLTPLDDALAATLRDRLAEARKS